MKTFAYNILFLCPTNYRKQQKIIRNYRYNIISIQLLGIEIVQGQLEEIS